MSKKWFLAGMLTFLHYKWWDPTEQNPQPFTGPSNLGFTCFYNLNNFHFPTNHNPSFHEHHPVCWRHHAHYPSIPSSCKSGPQSHITPQHPSALVPPQRPLTISPSLLFPHSSDKLATLFCNFSHVHFLSFLTEKIHSPLPKTYLLQLYYPAPNVYIQVYTWRRNKLFALTRLL